MIRFCVVAAGTAAVLALSQPAVLADEAMPMADVPVMHEQALDAGIDHSYTGGWEFFVGGGGASFDCNGDRLPDVFLAGGRDDAAFYVNHSATGGPLRFVEKKLDIDPALMKNVLGAYALDIDNDGHRDLVLLRLGKNIILKGGPDCTFTVANDLFHFDGGNDWTTSFSATWEAGNGFPTLAFGNYVDRTAPGSPWGTCSDNQLYRPQPGKAAPGSMPDYSDRIPLSPGYCSLSMLFTDWNNSGTPSLRVANDRQYYRGGEEQMWQIDPGKQPRLYTRADGWQHLSIYGMGIAQGDLNGDGRPEYAITSMGDTKLQKLDDQADEDRPIYDDIAYAKGATAQRPYEGNDLKPSTGWHSEFADFNNDGVLDLYIAKGNVSQMPDFAAVDPDNLLLGGWDGKFTEVGHLAGIDLPTKGRGALVEDFNMDGKLDLLVVNREHRASLFRNLGALTPTGPRQMGNFVDVELVQDGGNRGAVGALVSVKWGNNTSNKTVQVGGGHASGHAGFVHIGVGTAERAEVRIKWPDGEWSPSYRVFANNFVQIRRGTDSARYWYPPVPDAWQAAGN